MDKEYDLVIVAEQQEVIDSDKVITTYYTDTITVIFRSYLTAEGGSLAAYDKDRTPNLLFNVKKGEIGDLAKGLASIKSIWIVANEDCTP